MAQRQRLHVFYHGRARDQTTERDISPQCLVYYRDNWYLDAWCHWRKDLRTFSLDRLHVVDVLDQKAHDVADDELDRVLASAYGIFAGEPRHTAILRFSGTAARWVADEQWHPNQRSHVFPDGSMELRVPYSDPRELMQDILRFGRRWKCSSRRPCARPLATARTRPAKISITLRARRRLTPPAGPRP